MQRLRYISTLHCKGDQRVQLGLAIVWRNCAARHQYHASELPGTSNVALSCAVTSPSAYSSGRGQPLLAPWSLTRLVESFFSAWYSCCGPAIGALNIKQPRWLRADGPDRSQLAKSSGGHLTQSCGGYSLTAVIKSVSPIQFFLA